MRPFLLFFALLCLGAAAAQSLRSTTYIPVNQAFVLGGGTHGGYKATLANGGLSSIEVFSGLDNGVPLSRGILKTGQRMELEVAPNITVQLQNLGATPAVAKLRVRGQGFNLGMSYIDTK